MPEAAVPPRHSGPERRLFLVRHGETEGESSIRYHGRNDVHLAEEGRRQARALIPHLAGIRPVAIVHSPLQRARESAEILQVGLNLPGDLLEEDDGLTEVFFGDIEGMTAEEISIAMPEWFESWQAGRSKGFPGGETTAGFAARVGQAFQALVERHPQGDLLGVAHRGVLRWGMRHLLGPGETRDLIVDLGSLTVLRVSDRYELEIFNLVP